MKKNLVAMLLAVGIIATATGCGSTESTSTTSTTEYVTEEATTEEAQVEETTEYVTEEATTEETVEAAEEISIEDLTVQVREAMEAVPYVVSDYTVLVNDGADHNYTSYYNKEAGVIYKDSEVNGVYWTDIDTDTLYMLDAANNSYNIVNNKEYVDYTISRALNIPDIYKTVEEDLPAGTLDSVVDSTATVTINQAFDNGNNTTTVVAINTETGLIESKHYTKTNESGEVVSEIKLNLSYPAEDTPEYDEFIQKTIIPAEAIEATNNQ